MDSGRLDRKIKDRLLDHEEFIDKDELWAGISQKQRKDRFPFWKKGLALFTLLVVLSISLFQSSKNSNSIIKSDDNKNVLTTIVEEAKKSESNLNTSKDINDPVTTNNKNQEPRSLDSAEPIAVDSKNESMVKSVLPPTSLASVSENELKIISQIIPHASPQAISSTTIPTTVLPRKQSAGFVNTVNQSGKNLEPDPSLELLSSSAQYSENKEISTREILNKKDGPVISFLNPIDRLESLRFLLSFDQERTLAGRLLAPTLQEKKEEVPTLNETDVSCKTQVALNIYTSYGFINRTLSSQSLNHQTHIDLQNEKETLLEDLGLGLSLDFLFKEHYNLSIGIEKHRLQEYLDYTEEVSEMVDKDDQTITEVYNPDGSVESLLGTVSVIENTSTSYKVYNTFNSLDLPLSVGYLFKWKNLNLLSSINLVYNLNNSFTGYKIDLDNQVVQNPEIYKRRLGMSYGAALRLGYKLGASQQIWLEPKYLTGQKSIANSTNPIDQRYQFWFASLGYRHQF